MNFSYNFCDKVVSRLSRFFIGSLPPIFRDAQVWPQLEAMSQKDLAQKPGLSPTRARSRVQHALEKLK